MSGQSGHAGARGPATDEAARLEAALARIAKAASRACAGREAPRQASTALHGTGLHATTAAGGPDTAEIAARLDGLIAEIRALLRSQDI